MCCTDAGSIGALSDLCEGESDLGGFISGGWRESDVTYYINDGQSPKNKNVRIIAESVCSFECCTYCLCSYAKLAFFVVCFLSTKVRKGRGCLSGILREIDFQLFTSLTRMESISEYFSSLLIPYHRCPHRNFEFLKNPIF